jgi:hypothetical protein
MGPIKILRRVGEPAADPDHTPRADSASPEAALGTALVGAAALGGLAAFLLGSARVLRLRHNARKRAAR